MLIAIPGAGASRGDLSYSRGQHSKNQAPVLAACGRLGQCPAEVAIDDFKGGGGRQTARIRGGVSGSFQKKKRFWIQPCAPTLASLNWFSGVQRAVGALWVPLRMVAEKRGLTFWAW